MERTDSLQDLVGNLWRLGRTPSEAEFTQFLAAGGAAAQQGGEGDSPHALGMHRVASIDLLRKMILNQQAVMSQAQAAQAASAELAAASGLGASAWSGCRAASAR